MSAKFRGGGGGGKPILSHPSFNDRTSICYVGTLYESHMRKNLIETWCGRQQGIRLALYENYQVRWCQYGDMYFLVIWMIRLISNDL